MEITSPPPSLSAPFAVYVHWPWCKAKCPYCDFNSHASTIQEEAYVNALLSEFRHWSDATLINDLKINGFRAPSRQIASLFFGGGTPSLMTPKSLEQIIDSCSKLGHITPSTEITLECNPTSFDSDRKAMDFFKNLKLIGINRVSIGLQGLKPEWLAFLGRNHSIEDAFQTLDAAQQVFDNVNSDIIYGLPNQKLDEWLDQLTTLAQRNLSHISAYQLTIEPNTHFYRDVRKGLWQPVSSDIEADFFDGTQSLLAAHGYHNYEISNFAKPNKACIHNLHIWRYGEYLGIGAGAHGRVRSSDNRIIATHIIRQPEKYLQRITTSTPSLISRTLTSAESVQEAFFLGLRLSEGLDTEMLQKTFTASSYKDAISTSDITFLCDTGLLTYDNHHLKLTSQGWPRLNAILSRILRPLTTADSTPQPAYTTPRTVVIE